MSHLVPCSACRRHVRATEESCPFCGSVLEWTSLPPRAPQSNVSRAALLVMGALAVAPLGCSDDDGGSGGGSPDASADGQSGSGGSGATGGGSGSGGGSATGGTAGNGGTAGSGGAAGSGATAGSGGVAGNGGDAGSAQAGFAGFAPPYGLPPD